MHIKITAPVCIFFYNRPEKVDIMINALKDTSFNSIYLIQDGPKNFKDKEKVIETRTIIEKSINAKNIIKLYRTKNLGLKTSIENGIDFVFKNESEAIFLEDDCIPNPTFFEFCDRLLDYYKNDLRIGAISGYNHFNKYDFGGHSFGFSEIGGIWGWATWKDRWESHNRNMDCINNDYIMKNVQKKIANKRIAKVKLKIWNNYYNLIKQHQSTSWDFPWGFTRFINSYLTIIPNVNLISNIGVESNSTHNKFDRDNPADKNTFLTETYSIDNKLIIPNFIIPDYQYDRLLDKKNNPNYYERAIKRLAKIKSFFRG